MELTLELLTLMATLDQLAAGDQLHRLEPELPPTVQPERIVFGSTRFADWVANQLPRLRTIWKTELSPLEQVAVCLEDFCSGAELSYGFSFAPLHPNENSVWELKTPDIRIFGFFNARDVFVAVVADCATRIKEIGLYAGYVGEVVRFREQLDLDPPKCIEGTNPYAVVSNYSFP